MTVRHKNLETAREQIRKTRDALEVDREQFPAETVCAACSNIWMAHKGLLCPEKGSAQRKQQELMPMVATGVLPKSALEFVWAGTYFIPLHEGSDVLVAL